jgi:hypothetical protein
MRGCDIKEIKTGEGKMKVNPYIREWWNERRDQAGLVPIGWQTRVSRARIAPGDTRLSAQSQRVRNLFRRSAVRPTLNCSQHPMAIAKFNCVKKRACVRHEGRLA